MAPDLDDLLRQLGMAPIDRSLEGLEPLVWSRVDALRGDTLASQLRLGAVVMALATGLTAGGVGAVAAPRPPGDMAVFTVAAGLSPLAGLETGR